eukprot:227059-Pyramimonas_sp.AAC.1
MGWSWALHLCQCFSEAAPTPARAGPAQEVRDRSRGVVLAPELPAAGAAHAGNYLVAGTQRAKIQAVGRK